MNDEKVPGSFRDPSGYLFVRDDVLFRRISLSYREHYDVFLRSGLYQRLVDRGLLVAHEEIRSPDHATDDTYLDIKPTRIPFISYPYEWSFSQLKDAALLTLEIQKEALAHGMCLKDASAYNVQFDRGQPVLIDTLSFETHREGSPWGAYKQFCQHFLAPLAVMSLRDVTLNQLLRVHLDGLPLSLASQLIPPTTYLSPRLLIHLHLHAWSERRYGRTTRRSPRKRIIKTSALLAIVESLEKSVGNLAWKPEGTEWARYYSDDQTYSGAAMAAKQTLVSEFLDAVAPKSVWDVGANVGVFSRLASSRPADVVSFDVDPACVELNYLHVRRDRETRILPLLMDLTNPSPAIGWDNRERMSLLERPRPDVVLALALIHHLAISNNVPLDRTAAYFAKLARHLIIEFVPKEDSMVQHMLATRDDIFSSYTRHGFEVAFTRFFVIDRVEQIAESHRVLYLMTRRDA